VGIVEWVEGFARERWKANRAMTVAEGVYAATLLAGLWLLIRLVFSFAMTPFRKVVPAFIKDWSYPGPQFEFLTLFLLIGMPLSAIVMTVAGGMGWHSARGTAAATPFIYATYVGGGTLALALFLGLVFLIMAIFGIGDSIVR